MSKGGPYSKRHRCWPYRHAGGSGGKKRGSSGLARSSSPVASELPAALLGKRARREQRCLELREEATRAVAGRRQVLAGYLKTAQLTQAERNLIVNAGGFPPGRMVTTPVFERRTVTVKSRFWPYEETETKDVQVGTIRCLPGDLARHYRHGSIPRNDIFALQEQGLI